MKQNKKEFFTRSVLLSLTGLVVVFGFFGVINTEAGQRIPFIQKIALWMGYNKPVVLLSAPQIDQYRAQAILHLKGGEKAPSRPAMGLELDKTTMREASNWLQNKGLSCIHGVHGYAFLRCKKVSSQTLGLKSNSVIDEMDLSFSSSGKLIAVNLLRRKLSALQGVDLISDIAQTLRGTLGIPTKVIGENAVKTFATAMNSVSIEYNFKDYLAKVTASYLPWSGVVLYEQYMSYRD